MTDDVADIFDMCIMRQSAIWKRELIPTQWYFVSRMFVSYRILQLIINNVDYFLFFKAPLQWCKKIKSVVVSWSHSFSSTPVVPDTLSWSHFRELSGSYDLYEILLFHHLHALYRLLLFLKRSIWILRTFHLHAFDLSDRFFFFLHLEYVLNDCIALSTVYLWKIERIR